METEDEFLELFDYGSRKFFAIGEYAQEDNIPNITFMRLLDLKESELNPTTIKILNHLESDENTQDLKFGYLSYLQFQDILSISFKNETDSFENRHYCYYESIIYFRASLISWLNKNVLAAMTLLRPFLELSILHLYWYINCEEKGYEYFYAWLKGKKEKPLWWTQKVGPKNGIG